MNAAADPWIVTTRERVKYQEQFKSLQPLNGIVTGAQAKGFFLQSQLPPLILGQIWALADTDSDGKMNIIEFSIACKLINLKLRGFELPKVLPPTLIASLSSTGGTPILTPTGNLSPLDPLKSLGNSIMPTMPPIIPPQPTIPQAIVPPLTGAPPMISPASMSMMQQSAPIIPIQSLISTGDQPLIPQTQIPMSRPPPMMAPAQQPLISMQPLIPPMTGGGSQPLISGQTPIIAPTAGINVVKPLIDPAKIVSPPTGDIATVLPAPPTPPSNPPSRSMSISERAPSIESPQAEWSIKGPIKLKYTQLFNTSDRTRSGYLTGAQARNLMVQTKLPQATLAQIWALSDMDSDGRLGCEEFVLAMYLCDMALSGEKIPVTLPLDMIPPSFRKMVTTRHGSVSRSRHGSVSGSRHTSISSQGAPADSDPLAGLPQTSFEDKRKENFDKGQAELDRRRKLLMDQQRKEQEERERKEREEAEKREKARLEAERKQQEELDRQLQRQREIEMEKEEQRKRALEAKEAARKELERQRQLEWEKQRIQEMQLQRQREQEKVLKLKAHNQTLNVELSTLNEKIKELSQKICDTRAGVTNVKSVIDGMRSTRDIQMSEMSQFKARIKEQNQKLMQLTQEKAKWDAKSKNIHNTDSANQEQMNAAFSNKQIIIKQLKDKLENIREEIESKKNDINSNDIQLMELKAELKDLINKCEELYTTYDIHRNQVLEIKNNRKNESYTSAWDSAQDSSWPVESSATINSAPEISSAAAIDDTGPAPAGFVKYRAIYEFFARNADEITFQPGDIVLVPLEQNAEPGWLAGEINGHTGWFPETYVEKIDTSDSDVPISSYNTQDTYIDNNRQPLEEIKEVAETTIQNDTITPVEEEPFQPVAVDVPAEETSYNGDIEYYIANYPYESAEAGDLNFSAGEMVMVTKKEGDWWTGTVGTRTGIFPSNYVQKADVGGSDVGYTQPETIKEETVNGTAHQQVYETQPEIIDNTTITTPTTITETTTTSSTVEEEFQEQQVITTPTTTTEHHYQEQLQDDSKIQQEDVDTEVSQINTQPKNVDQVQETYSRPMSRTSSMTPGMRGGKKPEIAQVIAPYESTSHEQLTLQRGQLIMIRKKTDSGWWEGELQVKGRRRQIGWFPASYVKVLQGGRNSGRNTPVSASKIEMTETILDKVIALYPYKAQNDDELSFEKDDIISVLGRDEQEWWRGESNGLTGLFPSNYVGPFVSSGNV